MPYAMNFLNLLIVDFLQQGMLALVRMVLLRTSGHNINNTEEAALFGDGLYIFSNGEQSRDRPDEIVFQVMHKFLYFEVIMYSNLLHSEHAWINFSLVIYRATYGYYIILYKNKIATILLSHRLLCTTVL
ncbi:hypothetical protein ACJX0J_014225, partial [Zea mays]